MTKCTYFEENNTTQYTWLQCSIYQTNLTMLGRVVFLITKAIFDSWLLWIFFCFKTQRGNPENLDLQEFWKYIDFCSKSLLNSTIYDSWLSRWLSFEYSFWANPAYCNGCMFWVVNEFWVPNQGWHSHLQATNRTNNLMWLYLWGIMEPQLSRSTSLNLKQNVFTQ